MTITERRMFKVPGEARGKMRPKASAFAGHARVYTPAKQVEYENWVRLCYEGEHPDAEPMDGPVAMRITIRMAPPKGISKKKRAMMLSGGLAPSRKPDIDNAAKSVMDALNGIAYRDDALVWSLTVQKIYDEEASVWVELMLFGEGDD